MSAIVPDIKDALVTVLNAHTALDGVDTSRATPRWAKDHAAPAGAGEAIWIGRQGGQDTEGTGNPGPMIGGALDPNEAFNVWLTVGVIQNKSSGTEETTQERAWAIGEEVLHAVFADPTLGITHGTSRRVWLGVTNHEWVERNQALDQGWACHIEFGFACLVRRLPN